MAVVQDLVAIFIAEFHATKGNIIEWSRVLDESISLESVAFNVLPSKVQTVATDVIYFTKGAHQGVSVFRRITSDEESRRGARMISVGVLVENSTRPRPWNHISALKRFAVGLEDNIEERDSLEAYFKEHKATSSELMASETLWNGWEDELSAATMDHPAFHLSHILNIMGISSLTLFKHALGRRRILIHTHPPVESACVLAQLAAVISTGGKNKSGIHTQRITVLGMVGLTDLKRIEETSARGNGWIACTTDAIFLEKTQLYDLLIDLTGPTQQRPQKASLSISRLPDNSAINTNKLQSVRYTWSDVKLWTELERLLQADVDFQRSHEVSTITSRLTDPWKLYDDVCIVCAGFWTGWKPSSNQGRIELSTEHHSHASSESTPATSASTASQSRISGSGRELNRMSIDPRLEPLPSTPTTRAKVTTLSLLSAFHNHTEFLLNKLAEFLAANPEQGGFNQETIMNPKDVATFDLGPGSELDARFLEWLGETKGKKVKVRRAWKDLFRYLFGFA